MRFRVPSIVMLVLGTVLVQPPVFPGRYDTVAWASPPDPPARVGRLNYISGSVSFAPPGVNEWAPAILNYPLTTGASLWADAQARAEFHVGSTIIRLDHSTALEILNLNDDIVQLRLSQGTISVGVHDMASDERFELDTPSAAISLLRPGAYRIDVTPDGISTQLTVRVGDVEITTSSYDFHVYSGQVAVISRLDNISSYDIRPAASPDAFDQWATARERQEQIALQAARYVTPAMTGFEDLTVFGAWRVMPDFGPVWIPAVPNGWAPFRFGRWVWVQPWGWTWVAAEPWGFAPFHFGRWVLIDSVWAWVPGPVVVRPVFAPALVVFVTIGDFVGWFPLAPREVFIPSYACSATYVQRINIHITNVTVINQIREHDDFLFQHRDAAVTIVRKTVFTETDSVLHSRAAVTDPLIGRARVVGTAVPVAPTERSVLGAGDPAWVVARPPVAIAQRPVVVRQTPPPVLVPFKAQEQLLTANPGRPLDPQTLAALRKPAPDSRLSVLPRLAPHPHEREASQRPASTLPPVPMPPRAKEELVPTPQPVPVPPPTQPTPATNQASGPLLRPAAQPVLPVEQKAPQPHPESSLHPVPPPRPEAASRPEHKAPVSESALPSQGQQARPPATRRPDRTPNCDPHSRDFDHSRCPKKAPQQTH